MTATTSREYFSARDVVTQVKKDFGGNVRVDLLLKNIDHSPRTFRANVDQIDSYIPEKYSREDVERIIKEAWDIGMALFFKSKPKGSSAFSEFIRNAKSSERKRVYSKVLDKAVGAD